MAGASEPEAKIDTGQYIDVAPVALPVAVNNRLINYVFVQVRINLSPTADAPKLREREPWFRDALVRAAHRTPFTNPRDFTIIDDVRMKATLLREAALITPARNLLSVTLISQTPKQRSRLPRPAA